MLSRVTLPSAPFTVSAFCLGGGGFGSSTTGDALDRLVGAFLEAGGDFFDTAHCYAFWAPGGAGCSERALGACLRGFGVAERVIVATKGAHPAVLPDYPRPDGYMDPDVVRGDIAESLARLERGTIDLYYLHRDDPRVPVAELLDALNGEIAAGRLRALGASNWSTARLAEANACAAARGWTGFSAAQPMWNLAAPNFTATADPTMRFLLPADAAWHAASGVAVIPYSPTANGYFATGGTRGGSFENPTTRARLARAEALAAELGVSPNQLALAWLQSHPFPVVPILGAGNPAHLADALATTVTLNEAQRVWLAEG